jgi:hypothetical protein
MSLGAGAGVAGLTTVAGGLAGAGLAMLMIAWQQMPSFEGGSGYFAVLTILAGMAAGFVIGLVTALTMSAGFWTIQLRAVEMVAGVALFIGLLVVAVPLLRRKAPMIGGEPVVLEVELRAPPEWKAARAVEISHGTGLINGRKGWLEQRDEAGVGCVLACYGVLENSGREHKVRVELRHRVDEQIEIRLPDQLAGAERWSGWTGTSWKHRFRLWRTGEFERARELRRKKALEERRRAMEALPADGPLAQWLPFLESDSESPFEVGDDAGRQLDRVKEALNQRPAQLAPLLSSDDNDTARRALFAVGYLGAVPASLMGPLLENGRHMGKLIAEARACSEPGDPDLVAVDAVSTFYGTWRQTVRETGEAGAAARRTVIEEIARELGNDSETGLFRRLTVAVRSELQEMGAAGKEPQ